MTIPEQTKEEIRNHIVQDLHNALDNLGFKNPEKMERFLSENSMSAKPAFFENKCNTSKKESVSAIKDIDGLKSFRSPCVSFADNLERTS